MQLDNGRAAFPARVGSFGSACAAHAHTRARAHARARPQCTLQHTIPWSCTCSTPAHSCTCTLTRAPRRGAGGRGGRRRARHGRARPNLRRRGPPRGLQPPQVDAAGRLTDAVQFGGCGGSGRWWPIRAARGGSFLLQWPQMPARRLQINVSAAHERVASKACAPCLLVEVVWSCAWCYARARRVR